MSRRPLPPPVWSSPPFLLGILIGIAFCWILFMFTIVLNHSPTAPHPIQSDTMPDTLGLPPAPPGYHWVPVPPPTRI